MKWIGSLWAVRAGRIIPVQSTSRQIQHEKILKMVFGDRPVGKFPAFDAEDDASDGSMEVAGDVLALVGLLDPSITQSEIIEGLSRMAGALSQNLDQVMHCQHWIADEHEKFIEAE
jgi:hypothetical protein